MMLRGLLCVGVLLTGMGRDGALELAAHAIDGGHWPAVAGYHRAPLRHPAAPARLARRLPAAPLPAGGLGRVRRGHPALAAGAAAREPERVSLLALLGRFAVEAAREEARMFCEDLVADDSISPLVDVATADMRLVA